MKSVYVKVKLMVNDDANVDEVISEMDYDFDHDEIQDTEILDYEEGTNA